MDCPTCGLMNPEAAQRCDCGFDFRVGEIKQCYMSTKVPKRPIMVSIIMIYYILATVWMVFSYLLIASMWEHLPEVQKLYFRSLSTIDYLIISIMAFLNLAGAVVTCSR